MQKKGDIRMAKDGNTTLGSSYGDQSISALKGADRVRKRPGVIFGSAGLEGCEHSYFEILSNSVDEAREGHGNEITTTLYKDKSIKVDDRGRGVPLGYNKKEERWNWDLIYCELYAGGKYDNNKDSSAYEFSLGLNGLGACATQYTSEFMEVYSYDGTTERHISFKKGNPVTGILEERALERREKRTGTVIHWRPDKEVFADINIPADHIRDILKRQAVVNAGISFVLREELDDGSFTDDKYFYENGISDYIKEIVGDSAKTEPVLWHLETQGRDAEDRPEYRLIADFSFCISNMASRLEYYHNSSFLEHGGSPDRAVKSAFTFAIDKYLKSNNKYNKNESKITFVDIADCLVYISNSFSTVTSYENQTKKAITNSFIYEAMNEFLRRNLEIFFTEHPLEADIMANQVLINKRSRETAESTRIDLKKKLTGSVDNLANRVEKFVNCRSKDPNVRELYIVEGDSALTSCKLGRSA